MTATHSPGQRSLPIFWKLLLPFLVLLVIVGSAGAYVIVRDLADRSSSALTEQLTLRAVDARSLLHDRELDLIEAANYAANLNGIADAVRRGRPGSASDLLQSVLTLKGDLSVVAVTDSAGRTVAQLNAPDSVETPSDWSASDTLREAIASAGANKAVGFGSRSMLVAAPICDASPCAPRGYAVVGFSAENVAEQLASGSQDGRSEPEEVTLFDSGGRVLASTSARRVDPIEPQREATAIRRGHGLATAYTPFRLAGRPAGTVAVTVPASSVLGAVRTPALRLISVLLLALVAAVFVGAWLSRRILRQLHAVVDTSRQLGAGDLSARAPVLADDEHGELAAVLNQMAEQLQAERASLELQVEQRTEEVRRLLRDRTDFFAGLSHELRTPLAVIATQAELLRSQRVDRRRTNEAGEAIAVSAGQLLDVINEILELARVEAGGLELHISEVSLRDAFGSVSPMLVGLGAAADVDVHVERPRRIPNVIADPARLQQILVNLVDNAIKYTPAGGSVQVAAAAEGSRVVVSVVDNGIGIPEDVGDRVFEPFYRVSSTTPHRGQASSGLGLALARRAVEAQGGEIAWHPRDAGGTVFTFTVPIAEAKTGRGAREPKRVEAVAAR